MVECVHDVARADDDHDAAGAPVPDGRDRAVRRGARARSRSRCSSRLAARRRRRSPTRTCRGGRSRSAARSPRRASSTCISAAARTRSRSPTCRSSSGSCSRAATSSCSARCVGAGVVYGLSAGCRRSSSSSTSPSSRSPSCVGVRDPARARRRRRRAAARDLGRPLRRHAGHRRADDRLHRRRDRDRRGQPDARRCCVQMFATDALVTLTNASIAIAAALVVATDAARRPGAARPGADRLRRLPRLRLRAPAPRAARVPLRRQPHAHAARPRSPRRSRALLARSLEAFRADVAEVLLFTADGDAAAHHLRPGRPPRDDGRRPTARSPTSSPRWSTPRTRSSRSRRRSAPPHLRAHLQARGIRHAMIAMLPGEERMIGTIMLANRVGLERSFGADDLRLLEALANNAARRAAVRPARAGRHQAARAAGPAAPPGLPRPAHRPAEPHAVHGARARRARRRTAARSPCCSSTSTTSRPSTTRSATPSATRCSSPSPSACATACAPRTSSPASAATSSRS